MDLCNIRIGGKYILNVNEYIKMSFRAPDWMFRFSDEYGDVPVVVDMIDKGGALDVLIFPSYDDLPIIPNKSDQLWWVCSECLRTNYLQSLRSAFQNSEDLDELFENM